MSETKTTLTWLLRDEVSATAGKIDKKLKGMGETGKGVGGMLSGLVNPSMLAAGAIGVLGGVLIESVTGAIEAEKGIARLDAALKANVPGWNGNTKAIDDSMTAMENLGFKNTEVRDSLTKLIVPTHNVAKAEDAMKVAADLARLKGISLADATDTLTRIEGGRFKGLAALGIKLKDGATLTDALAAVEQAAQGQASSYADTIDGKLNVAQAKMNNAMDRAGEKLLPLVATGLDLVSSAIDNLASGVGPVIPVWDALNERFARNAHIHTTELIPALKTTMTLVPTLAGIYAVAGDQAKSSIAPVLDVWNRMNAAVKLATTRQKEWASMYDKNSSRYATFQAWLSSTGQQSYGTPGVRGRVKPHAEGGWVGLNGPELGLLGEKGPEYVIPHNKLGGGAGGFTIQGVSERELVDMVDRGLYFKLRRSAAYR
jgi:hypothetical protein